jgi:hypothetical protein
VSQLTKENRKKEYLRELGILVYSMFTSRKGRLTPIDFLDTFQHMEYKVQRDIYEFFNEFLNNLEDSLKIHEKPLTALEENTKGEFINEIRFVKCGHIVPMHKEEFIVLSLEVREMGDIRRSLEYFSHWELLQSSPKECPKCQQLSPREKRTRIGKLPKELIIHLKRFQFEKGRFVKLNEGFSFTNELEIEEETQNENESDKQGKRFKLRGVVCHLGSVEYGHYVSLVKKNSIRHLSKESDEDQGINEECMNNLKQFNFIKKIRLNKENKNKSKWILYNDDNVTEYNEANLPKDCFGEFKDKSEYSLNKFLNENTMANEMEVESNNLSEEKMSLFKDLGVYEETENKEEDEKEKELKAKEAQIRNSSRMNAYLLFYRQEGKEDSGIVDKIIQETRKSPFGEKVQLDIDRELILENRFNVFSSKLGFNFMKSLLMTSFKSCLSDPNETNIQFLLDSFEFVCNYYFKFLCQFSLKSKNKEFLSKTGNLLHSVLSQVQIQETIKKCNIRVDERFDEKLQERLLRRFSLLILKMFNDSVESKNALNMRNLSLNLISSNDDVYCTKGNFFKKSSSVENRISSMGKFSWISEIYIECLSNITSQLDSIEWEEKRIVFNFLKICLKMLVMYQINASAYLVILLEALESKEICFMLYRFGLQSVLLNLIPHVFEEISNARLQKWIIFREYFKMSIEEGSPFDKCKTIQDYYIILFSDKNNESQGNKYFYRCS